jgi:HK97 family phage major capsid protein/HK97 family phage prohead protease
VSLTRAYSVLDIKAVDDEQRIITGIATTPATDRVGDVVEPEGAEFTLPIPLLWQHDAKQPIGEVFAATVTPHGIEIKARIAKIDEPGKLKDRLDEAWQSIKSRLVRGLSIGFSGLEVEPIKHTFGVRFLKWLWLELSAVTIPANHEASISSVKQFDTSATAIGSARVVNTPGVSGTPVVRLLPSRQEQQMKSISEQINSYRSTRDQKFQEQSALMTKAAEEGRTLDTTESESYDTLDAEVKSLDAHIRRLEVMQDGQKAAAVPVAGTNAAVAAHARSGEPAQANYVSVRENTPPGIGFARSVMAKTVARLDNRYVLDVAKEMFPSDQRVHKYFETKATVTAGTSTNSVWASALVDQTNLAGEFIEYLRPATILGKFGMNGVPSLRRVPFNIRVVGQTTGGSAGWVGEGKPKPVTAFEFTPTTLLYTKVAAIAIITQELARFSTPSAESLVRDALRDCLVERLDRDFVDPAEAGSANVQPASITNGLTALTSAGTSADNARTDIQNLLEQFILNNVNPTSLVLIMPNTLALALSIQVNSLGQPEFPGLTMNGGTLQGIPVITSQYAANASGAGNLVIAVNASDVFLADDGQVTVDMSTEASVQMSDAPTNDAATGTGQSLVSMWQTNSIALRAERQINWAKRRSSAVSYMDDVNWGSIGSPS